MAKPVFVLNGPNLNMLGVREPNIYGVEQLENVRRRLQIKADELGLKIDFRQSNSEGQLVDWIQETRDQASGIILNAGAYTHTSIALLDALLSSELPAVEVHLSNVYRREDFRHKSYIAKASIGVICGFGAMSYELALLALADQLGQCSNS